MCQELPLFASVCMCLGAGLFRLCDSDFGIIPVAEIAIGTTCTASCFHMSRTLFASSWYLFCFSVIVLARLCVFGIAMSIRKAFFLVRESYVRPVGRYCFVRNNAAIPVQFEVVILQRVCWFVLIVWAFVFN
jgi:hypothetical protein